MTALKDQIRQALSSVGLPALSPSILSQMTALSSSLRLSPTQLAEAWEAHSLTKNVDELNDVTFTAYRNALAKEAEGGDGNNSKNNHRNKVVVSRSGLGKRTLPSSSVTPSPMAKRGDNRNGLSAVDTVAGTPSSAKMPISPAGKSTTGDTPVSSVVTPPKNNSNSVTFASTPKSYQDRLDPGTTVTSFNPHNLPSAVEIIASKPKEERGAIGSKRSCNIHYHENASHPQDGFRHMFTPLETRAGALEERLLEMNGVICQEHGVKSEEGEDEDDDGVNHVKMEGGEDGTQLAPWTAVGIPKQNKVTCIGRVCNEAHEGRLNRASIRLEGSRQHSSGSRVHLDPAQLPTYSLFPGQIVAVEGINSSGRTLQATRILEGATPPLDKSLASQLLDYQFGVKGQNGMPLSIVTLCGPFTTRDNLEYDPLADALVSISESKPDVVIMCGPFVDMRQPLVQSEDGTSEIKNEDGIIEKVSYEQVFAKKIAILLEELYGNDPEIKTQFVLVPSVEDAICDSVYPQPPLVDQTPVKVKGAEEFGSLGLNYVELIGRENVKGYKHKRVHCVSNPCTLRINELTIGVTSSDILFHISSDETNANLPPGSRLARIAQHLIQQRSYYPLFPAAKGACLDLSRAKQWEMPCQPDILITPSKLATFAKQVLNNTIVVNPGELAKNTTGGTYAVIDVHPMKRETLEDGIQADMEMNHAVQDRVRVDIKRI